MYAYCKTLCTTIIIYVFIHDVELHLTSFISLMQYTSSLIDIFLLYLVSIKEWSDLSRDFLVEEHVEYEWFMYTI